MKQWKVGDVVRLRSGGPAMTVSAVPTEGGVTVAVCLYFAGDTLLNERLIPDVLELAQPVHGSEESVPEKTPRQ